jgi:hypothetical protein
MTDTIHRTVAEGRSYRDSRYDCLDALYKIPGKRSVACQMAEIQNMVALFKSDRGDFCRIPALLLRLDMDQDSYDFIKKHYNTQWFEQRGLGLDIKKAPRRENIFEDVLDFKLGRATSDLVYAATTIILKIKVLHNMQTIAKQDVLHPAARQTFQTSPANARLGYGIMRVHIKKLHRMIEEVYPAYWALMLEADTALPNLAELIDPYDALKEAHMSSAALYTCDAWHETAGAVDVLKLLELGSF